MLRTPLLLVLFVTTILLPAMLEAALPLWQQMVPRKSVEADPGEDYQLQETNGPWLVMAVSFSGEEGQSQAEKLVQELRRNHQLEAYYYGMTFQQSLENPGRGLNEYGAPKRHRYNRGENVVEHAVLVGNFLSIEDPAAQQTLEEIKQLNPETLQVQAGEDTAQSLADVRELQNRIRERISPNRKRGPMGHAFLTRNPLLPREYFVPQGVDPEVAKWNESVEHSLMRCPGKYSIRVATFRGQAVFQAGKVDDEQLRTRQARSGDHLVAAAENAHKLTVALREKGWEAYEFHDRDESYVTVGHFDDGTQLQNGQIALAGKDAQTIINTFGASTPNPVFGRINDKTKVAVEQRKKQFNQLFSQGRGQEIQGFHPKQFVGIPFDIFPEPIRVPRKALSAVYARN